MIKEIVLRLDYLLADHLAPLTKATRTDDHLKALD